MPAPGARDRTRYHVGINTLFHHDGILAVAQAVANHKK
jgi:hypothetical protein